MIRKEFWLSSIVNHSVYNRINDFRNNLPKQIKLIVILNLKFSYLFDSRLLLLYLWMILLFDNWIILWFLLNFIYILFITFFRFIFSLRNLRFINFGSILTWLFLFTLVLIAQYFFVLLLFINMFNFLATIVLTLLIFRYIFGITKSNLILQNTHLNINYIPNNSKNHQQIQNKQNFNEFSFWHCLDQFLARLIYLICYILRALDFCIEFD